MAEPEREPEAVRTGADKLLELVKSAKELPMSGAASQLGVTLQTVEAWANFLEEDGLIAIKYRFTTPYVAIPEEPRLKKGQEALAPVVEFTELKAELGGMQDLLSKASNEKTSGEFSLLRQTYLTLLGKLRFAHEELFSKAGISPQRKVAISDGVRALGETLQEASSHASEGRFDQASISYARLYGQARALIGEMESLYEQMMTLRSVQETKDYRDIIGKAYELISEGKVREAGELYDKLKFAHENLSREFVEKKRLMEDDLVKFNKDLARKVDQLNLDRLKRVGARIGVLLRAGDKLLGKGEFDSAVSCYFAIKKEYSSLPPGFAEEKKEIQARVLEFYNQLAMQHEKTARKKFESSAREASALIQECKEHVKAGKVQQAIAAYRQLKQLYTLLPAGFLKEKAELQEKILPLYSLINSLYTRESVNELNEGSGEILSLVGSMREHTQRGEMREAEQAYDALQKLYRRMPKGFLHEETTLQSQIVQAYEDFLKKAKQLEAGSFSAAVAKLEKLLGEAESCLKRSDYAAANSAYLEVRKIYAGLPHGFVAKKTELRERVLRLYRAVLAAQPQDAGPMPVPEPAAPELPEAALEPPGSLDGEGDVMIEAEEPQPKGDAPESGLGGIDSEIDDIERKIDELKSMSRAAVKLPQ